MKSEPMPRRAQAKEKTRRPLTDRERDQAQALVAWFGRQGYSAHDAVRLVSSYSFEKLRIAYKAIRAPRTRDPTGYD